MRWTRWSVANVASIASVPRSMIVPSGLEGLVMRMPLTRMPWLRAPSYAATSASMVRVKSLELSHSIGSSLTPDLQQQSRSKAG
uniref:Acs7 n=1 Tax=Arundo donax TaxID=35708 RepID=A0A0A8Z4N2_ARUDO